MIAADTQGMLRGTFTIPPNVPCGSKRVEFYGSNGSRGGATFFGEGSLVIENKQLVTRIVDNWVRYDPLAQTFVLPSSTQIGGVELWFVKRGTSPVIVQIRESTAGFPNNRILSEARLAPSKLNIDGAHTRFTFPAPVALQGNTEYAFVVLCDDAITEVAVAEVGKWDQYQNRWITAQPYQVGVLLSSSNASTWTAHQDKDMAFRLLKANYTATDSLLPLGSLEVENISDVMLLGFSENPSSRTRVEYQLGIPNGASITVQQGQPVRLDQAVSGTMTLSARLVGEQEAAPVLWPGTQMVTGAVQTSADYISRAIPAGDNSTLKVIFDANLVGNSTVQVFCQASDAESSDWTPVPYHGSQPIDENWNEFTHQLEVSAPLLRVKLTLVGSTAFRPAVANLRVVTV